ncbi:uncharacterized protein LOC112464300 [Temnothorax curvispinosus]|uniref:Uncharacterized protein LOC112464300 n=1 Tax=Temnothorax curvispinosus TaxID=300111 RepID=A0A6J1QWE4_9HYME|nr:uncharacterized protein LOC112464300 [Temnothorax curvispinosus]
MYNIKLNSFDFHRSQDFYSRRVFFIVLITISFATGLPSRRTTDRSVILKNFMERQNQRDEASKYLIPCTAKFIEEYFEYPDRISLLLPDMLQDISVVIETLMNELRITSAIYTLNVSLTNVMETYDALTNVVILSESGITLEANDSSFVNDCEHDCNFIIVLTNLFTDEESFLIEAGTLVQQMSLGSIFKLEILASVGDSVLLASSLPVRINESYTLAEPAFSGRCEQQAAAIRWQRFTNKTTSLLDASTVNAAMFNNFPFTFFINDTNHFSFGGVEGSMVEEIARSMKIKLNRETIETMEKTTIKTEIYLRLYNATHDLVFGGLLWDFSRKVTYTTCYGMVHVSWIIPIETNVSLRGLISPFGANIWYAIICTLIAGGLVKLFVIRDITFLDIVALIFGVPAFRQPTMTSSRIQFISWTLFGFFLTQLYLGSLADYLIRTSDMQMESMEELANSGLKIGGTQRFADLLQTPDKADMEDNVDRMIREKLIILERRDYSNQLLALVEGRNTSLALLVMLNLTSNPSKIGRAHIIKETVGSYPLAFVTRQDFPYLAEFNFKIQILVQAGLVEFWSSMAMLNRSHYIVENEDDDSKIDIDDIAPAFFLLIMGCLGGCCLLIIEVIFYPSKLFL